MLFRLVLSVDDFKVYFSTTGFVKFAILLFFCILKNQRIDVKGLKIIQIVTELFILLSLFILNLCFPICLYEPRPSTKDEVITVVKLVVISVTGNIKI